jgi:hypothetical protein
LGISAPKDVTVLRSEIRVTRDINRAASAQPADPETLSLLVEQLRENSVSLDTPSSEFSAVLPPDEKKSNNP